MATHNIFRGYGRVIVPPRVIKNEEGYQRATCAIMTMRCRRKTGDMLDNIRFDTIPIRTSNKEQCEEIASWKVGDMVDVKGTVTSREIVRNNTCPTCGIENKVQGVATYVHPIFCTRIESGTTDEEGLKLLKYRNEISNNVTIIGMLTQEPQYHVTEKKVMIAKYQIAVMRRYRIKEDEPTRKADFIWIKSFGKVADTDKKYLKKGALIYIDGVLQAVPYDRKIVCSSCQEEYSSPETSLEIVPYAVEYLRDYIPQKEGEIDPEQDQIKYLTAESKVQEAANAVLASLSGK